MPLRNILVLGCSGVGKSTLIKGIVAVSEAIYTGNHERGNSAWNKKSIIKGVKFMKLIKLNCENCGAVLEVNKELDEIHCNYCGTKFLINDGSTTHTYRKVDEARIKEAEVSEVIRLKELELEEKKMMAKEKSKSLKIKISIILGIVGVICFGLDYATSDAELIFWGLGMFAFMAIMYIWIFGAVSGNINEEKNKDK